METNGGLQSVSRLIGHCNTQIIDRFYPHLKDEYLREKANIIGKLLPVHKSL